LLVPEQVNGVVSTGRIVMARARPRPRATTPRRTGTADHRTVRRSRKHWLHRAGRIVAKSARHDRATTPDHGARIVAMMARIVARATRFYSPTSRMVAHHGAIVATQQDVLRRARPP
jgi:hypothetical protein